ncbi:MAG: RNA polymerase sigma factor [Planctomycetaceae bacterium]|nr:RNA polymerase sigma factor [Planctomycetaceae bacterium]
MSARNEPPSDPVKKINALLKRTARGKRAAFTELCSILEAPLLTVVHSILHDAEFARDIVQETFLTVWIKRATFDPKRNGRAWIFRIGKNLAIDGKRARRRRPVIQLPDAASETIAVSAQAFEAYETREMAALVNGVIDSLPAIERKVFRLRIEGLRFNQIATRVSISVTMAWRLYRKAEAHIRQIGGLGLGA